MTSMLTLVSGPSGSGKSAWCSQLAEKSRADGLSVGGLLSIPVFIGERKVGIDFQDLVSGQRRRLANPRTETSEGPMTSGWCFNQQTLRWGNRILRTLPDCDIIIIDELGPLEFILGDGLQEGIRIIDSRKLPEMYVVVRSELIPQATKRWPWAQVINVGEGKPTID
jgi:nucleoside-triphosphatase